MALHAYLGLGEDSIVGPASVSSSTLISAACQRHVEPVSVANVEKETVKQVLLPEILVPDA